ncbi:Molybdopterin-guanine dinucleotide biosynthesis adapter protein [Paenibacillus allorhizoplanae]|uniref:Molybdopterin-guanine dinucleotide biosynthesis adapter protein n=1 Tax=Paenibacillus allorhizoplanae TaxID=2905648 RepID=A0ABN8G4R6_9BACL|nr:molybdopterin-guanine dinucleotide biosynthesis protein B [Paenibacillus allorhizoplanae]CAH1199578.1 Molybdopterin-guanine dinucleotide biosynthesis adapter protein [Paenibacillus allorhizoplanae]
MAHCLGFAGFSNSGKTTLVAKLIVEMKQRGHRIAVMKHDAHGHYKEAQGADSTVFVETGADAVVTLSPNGVHIYEKNESPSLEEQLVAYAHLDYIFIEGFKREKHPKIGVYRTIEQKELLKGLAPSLIAVATDLTILEGDFTLPHFNLNDIRGIADFIEQFFMNCQF